MTAYEKERQAVANAIAEHPLLWIQIYGADVEGRALLVPRIRRLLEAKHQPLLEHDFTAFPLDSQGEEALFYRHFLTHHTEELMAFQAAQSRGIGLLVKAYLTQNAISSQPDIWERNLFSALVNFHIKKAPRYIVFNNLPDIPSPGLLGVVRALQELSGPLVVVSTGDRPLPMERLEVFQSLQVPLEKLPVRDAEHLVAGYANTSAINARLISNHLYIKSGGQTRLIRPMVDAFFRQILPDDNQTLVENHRLQQIKLTRQPKHLFDRLSETLPEDLRNILAFLARLNDPLPMSVFIRLAKALGTPRSALARWFKSGLLHRATYQEIEAVVLHWQEWRLYLRQHVQVEQLAKVFGALKNQLETVELPWAVELSSLYDLSGDHQTALWLAHKEALHFANQGKQRRALERFAYLRRNRHRFADKRALYQEILGEQGKLQFEMGLYENAFESLRDYRESLTRDQSREWIRTSLTMADALIRMDAFQEARYLIKELKPKDIESPFVKAFADLLLGELEENLGHPDYANRHYLNALEAADQSTPEWLIQRIFSQLQKAAMAGKLQRSYADLLKTATKSLHDGNALSVSFNLEGIREMMSTGDVLEALQKALELYRKGPPLSHPTLVVQLNLYLAEIYGYLGKWQLSRSYLARLLREPLLTPEGPLRIQVEVDLAIVEKELGHYGASLELLENALLTCGTNPEQARLRHQIFVHMGHIHLLVQGVLRARELLEGSLQWAQAQSDSELAMQAALFLTSYEIQLERTEAAERFLAIARANTEQVDNALDILNLGYYEILLLVYRAQYKEAKAAVMDFRSAAKGVVKFEVLGLWLGGKVAMELHDFKEAEHLLKSALDAALRFRLSQITLQVYRDLSRLALQQNNDELGRHYAKQATKTFETVLAGVGDEILQRQMAESREYQALRDSVKVG